MVESKHTPTIKGVPENWQIPNNQVAECEKPWPSECNRSSINGQGDTICRRFGIMCIASALRHAKQRGALKS